MPLAGASGPYRDYLGYGMSIAALVGIYGLSGLPGRLPVGTGTNYPEHMPNPLQAAFAIPAAVAHRERTGEGPELAMAPMESTIAPCPAAPPGSASGRGRACQTVENSGAA